MSERVLLEIAGKRFDFWKTIKVTKSIDNFCGTFFFTSSALQNNKFPVKQGDSCRVIIENTPIMTGWVEKISVRLDADSHTITVSGRDRTNDVLDSQPDMKFTFNPPITLKEITETVLKNLNLSHIKVIDKFNLKPFKSVASGSVGTTAFEFLETYAKKSQVLLSTNGEGNIVFERAEKNVLNTMLSNLRNTRGIILNSSVDYDDTKRFHLYNSVSGISTIDPFAKVSTQQAANVSGNATDNEIRDSRVYYFQPSSSGTVQINGDTAKWEANYRRAYSQIYTCEVQGYKPPNDKIIWQPNYLVKVIDEFMGITKASEPLLIKQVDYSLSLDEGAKTSLTLLTNDAFTLQVNKPLKSQKSNNVANPFIKS